MKARRPENIRKSGVNEISLHKKVGEKWKSLGDMGFLYALHICNDGFFVSLPLLLPFIRNDLHISLVQVGFLGTVLNGFAIFLALPAGVIAARWGGIKSLIFALGVYSLGFFLVSASLHYWLIVVAFMVAGLGFGIFHPIGFATVANLSSSTDRGKNMGMFTAIGDVGRVLISAGITALAAYFGWRYAGTLYGIAALIAFVILLTLYRSRGNSSTRVTSKETAPISYFLTHTSFMLASLTAALDSFASSSLFVFIPFLLLSRGVTPAALGIFTGLFFVGNFLGKSMLGRCADRYGNVAVFIVAELGMAASIMLFALSQNWIVSGIIAVVLGALTKGTVPVIQTMIAEVTEHDRAYEKVFALSALVVSIATTIAPLLFGVVADEFGIIHVFTVSACFAIFAIVAALATRIVERAKRGMS